MIVESDTRVLVQLVGSKALSKWPLCTVLREIRHHIGRLEATLLHVFREANAVADALASLQLGEHRLFESLTALPFKARGEARLDCNGVPRIRFGKSLNRSNCFIFLAIVWSFCHVTSFGSNKS